MDKDLKFFHNSNSMNGLVNFIAEMRTCRVRDLEQKRVNKELANIRSKFKDSKLNGYNKKKYVAKLLYMYILGYEIDFGHAEAINLMSSTKYSEKHVVQGSHDLSSRVIRAIKADLSDHNEIFNSLALDAVANLADQELSEALVLDVYQQFVNKGRSSFVKKKAGLCLLRIYRKYPKLIQGPEWADDIIKMMDDANLCVVHSAVCLITALVQTYPTEYSGSVSKAILRLNRIVVDGDSDPNYAYYKIPAPWLQVKLLRLLQYYPAPLNAEIALKLDKLLRILLCNAETPHKNHNQGNAVYSILFETINYIIHLDPTSSLVSDASIILGHFLGGKDINLRYLALETMAHIAATGDPLKILAVHQPVIIESMKNKDISIRRRALDLLYSMCNATTSQAIVSELLGYLSNADYEFQEELVLKIAILAEKFVSEYTWYVDVILKLVTTAGDASSESLWHRVVQIVTNHGELREYATYTVFQAVNESNCHEVTVRIAGHLLGEFGNVIVELPGCSPINQFNALHSKFKSVSAPTKAMLLSTFLKFANLFPEIRVEIVTALKAFQYEVDSELQQRACEYLGILDSKSTTILQIVCEQMPAFTLKESSLMNQLTAKIHTTEDIRTWTIQESIKNDADPVDDEQFKFLRLNPNGVLYEDEHIQVGMKTEYHEEKGRVALYFGNKTAAAFKPFEACFSACESPLITLIGLSVDVIQAKGQEVQMYSIEAISIPLPVKLNLTFNSLSITIPVPILVTKFFSNCSLDSQDFATRWKQLGEMGKDFSIIVEKDWNITVVLQGLGFEMIKGDNNGFAAIFSAVQIGKVGVLVKVEAKDEVDTGLF